MSVRAGQGLQSVWFNCRDRSSPKIRLYCFPWSGGGSAIYRNWATHFLDEIEVVGIRYPGRESRMKEPVITSMPVLVQKIVQEILHCNGDVPFAFFGHSMGVGISFEAAKLLKENYSKEPLHLFMSGHNAPHSPARRQNRDDPNRERWCVLSDKELLKRVEKLGGTPATLLNDKDFMLNIFLPPFRADITVSDGYFYEKPDGYTPFTCPITVLNGTEDRPVADMNEFAELTSGPFETRTFPGRHFYFYEEENLKQLAKHISKALFKSTL